MKHIRQISALPAPAFEVQPNLFLRLVDVLFQHIVLPLIGKDKAGA